MAKIDRVTLGPVQVGAKISPNTASEASIAAAQESSQIQQQGQDFFDEAKVAIDNSTYAARLVEANEILGKRIQERTTQTHDEDGNPTFESLPGDVKNITREVRDQMLAKTSSPAVRTRLKLMFSDMEIKNQSKALSTARIQAVDQSLATFKGSFEGLVEQAKSGDPSDLDEHMVNLNEITTTALQSGLITANQRQELMSKAEDDIIWNMNLSSIQEDPRGMLESLEKGNSHGLSPERQRAMKSHAKVAVRDLDSKEARLASQEQAKISASQQIMAAKLKTGIVTGEVQESDILAAEANGHISLLDSEKLKQQYYRQEDTAKKSNQINAEISESMHTDGDLSRYKDSDLNNHFLANRQAYEEQQGQKMGILEQAQLAQHYPTEINAFTSEATKGLLFGDQQQGLDSARAINHVSRTNPIGAFGIDKKTKLAASLVEDFENSGLSGQDAIRLARESVLNVDPNRREERTDLYGQEVKELASGFGGGTTSERMQELVEDKFDEWGATDVQEIEPGMLAQMAKLERELYIMGGDIESANSFMSKSLENSAGLTNMVSDGQYAMMFPPEKVFPNVPAEHLRDDLHNDLADLGLDPMDVRLVADTASMSSSTPSWKLVKIVDGLSVPVQTEDGQQQFYTPDTQKLRGEKIISDALQTEQKLQEAETKRTQQIVKDKMKDIIDTRGIR